jgi:hypothetical protein
MSKTALLEAVHRFDTRAVRTMLTETPRLRDVTSDQGWNLLQLCCARSTAGNPAAARRQLGLAQALVDNGFDPHVTHTTKPGEDGEADPAVLSLVFFAVARAQNNSLTRFLLARGVKAEGLFAAAWWGNWEILADLVRHGADPNVVLGSTPFHMAVAVLDRGVAGKPALARARERTLTEFLRLGSDPNLCAPKGDTPLHTVLRKGYDVKILERVLAAGGNPDLPGRDGRSVRQIARRKRNTRFIAAIDRAVPGSV